MKRTLKTRILCLILALCTVFTMVPVAFATEAEEPVVTEPVVETQPVETEPEQTEPEETVPEETVPEETVPEETVPEETVPEETVPEETVPEETVPEETVPEETVPEETVPEETVPEETVPEETVPEETIPLDIEMDAEIPFGLKGMPEDYVFTEKAIADKVFMNEYDVAGVVSALVPGEDYAPGEILVDAESLEEAEMMAAAFNGYLKSYTFKLAVITLDGVDVPSAVVAAADMRVRLPAASPNYIIRLDPLEADEEVDLHESEEPVAAAALPTRQSWKSWVVDTMNNPDPYLLDPTGRDYNYQWMHDVVDTYAAWGITTGQRFVKVAVIDSGVNPNHVELSGRVERYRVTSSLGYDDNSGHGTHVAGIIAAAMDNGYGGAGIAPGVTIMSLKALDSDYFGGPASGYQSDIINAIYLAVNNGAYIINMSLGGPIASSSYQNAINYAYNNGVTVVVAMGNDGSNVKQYPAALKNVVSVVSTDETNNRSYFSNWGSWADVAAPGSRIWSLYNGSNYGMSQKSGTSMATPVVAGLAALYMSANGWVSPATMEKVLKDSCVKGGSNLGKGIVNAANMFSKTKPSVEYYVYDDYDNIYTSKTVPYDTYLYLYGTPLGDQTGKIVVTDNGKSPAIKDGKVVSGYEAYEGSLDLRAYAGKTVTVKAMAVNGLGIAGSVKTIKLTVSKNPAVSSVYVDGPRDLVAGKSATYTATVYPTNASQGVTWSIVDRGGMSSAKISSSGKLTTSSSQEGWVKIRATSKANSARYYDIYVYTYKIKPVASMALSQSSATLTLGTGYYRDSHMTLSVAKMVDSAKNPIDPNFSGVKWSSSKTSVATVDQYGNVTAIGPGSATITCKAQDGSGKSASCKVTVKQRVTGLGISGQSTLAAGASATYKAECYPSNANSKSVTWSLSNAPAGTKIDSKGKVTLPKSAKDYNGSYFYVSATTKDGSALTATYAVRIMPKCTELNISYSNQDVDLVKKKSNGYLSSAILYTYTLEDDFYYGDDTDIQLTSLGKTHDPAVKWSSSSPSVATVDQNGYVKAVKAGTTKITAAALDGSGKKATVTITVRNPISTMKIKSSQQRTQGEYGYLAFGKSATNSVVFGDAYGTVSNKSVTWSFRVYEKSSSGSLVSEYTTYCKNNKLVSLSSSGKLTTSSKVKNLWSSIGGDLMVRVFATSVDNPSFSTYFDYYLIRPATKMYADVTSGYMSRNSGGINYIYCDMWRTMYEEGYELTVTSSNPDIVGANLVVPEDDDSYWYVVQFYSGNKKGTATITVKANDGSGKSCKFKVKVT